jgi:hypothetical protein
MTSPRSLDRAYDRAAHAVLSFAADIEWCEGCDTFTPAAEFDATGWVIHRRRSRSDRRGPPGNVACLSPPVVAVSAR